MAKNILTICLLFGMWAAATPSVSFGQTVNLPYTLSNELGVEVVPTYPRPNEMITVTLSMYTEDLNSATITWYQDGKQVLEGKGQTQYSFKAGGVGQESRIEINITLLNGNSFSKILTITPAGVDLVWESSSYVPPFYQGKALHARQGTLKIVAIPEFVKNGTRISPQSLVYQWANDVESYQSQSGYGKNVLILKGSILGRGESVRVTVTDPVTNTTAYGSIAINPINPQIVFYENSPYYGPIFDSAINSSFTLKSDEIQIIAAPYYFSSLAPLKYTWRLNNQAAPSLSGSRTAIFKKPDDKTGTSLVQLGIENYINILQQADNSLQIKFNN